MDQIRIATQAYSTWDLSLASKVVEREIAINAYDDALDEEHLALLVRRQPVASDLKFVIAFSRAVAELERVGDEAKKIAKVVLEDDAPADRLTVEDIADLGQQAESLLRSSLEALDALDSVSAAAVIAADKELDAKYSRAMERLLSRPVPDVSGFRCAVHAAFIHEIAGTGRGPCAKPRAPHSDLTRASFGWPDRACTESRNDEPGRSLRMKMGST